MKTGKIFALLLALVLAAAVLSGCVDPALKDRLLEDAVGLLAEPTEPAEPYIGFTAEETIEDMAQLEKPDMEQLKNYQSQYRQYNSYIYYEGLNDDEKLIYHAYEYALDHSYPYFWVDQRLLQGLTWDTFDILWFLALDTPLVEQNLSQSNHDYTVTHSVFQVETASETYTRIYVENFTAGRLIRKLQAIGEAEQIVAQMPEGLTDWEKAEYYFDYLGENVSYEEYIEGEEYLYDALCLKKTNCDGYANAFSLLCSFSGPKCFEKLSDPEDGTDGHTWNAVLLDGSWINVDATGACEDVTSECENRSQERIYFGFPDALQSDLPLYQELVPACTEEIPPITRIPTGEIEDFTDKMKEAFRANDNKFAVILVDEGDLEKNITEDLATELGFDLHYTYYETAQGKLVYYLFENDPEE